MGKYGRITAQVAFVATMFWLAYFVRRESFYLFLGIYSLAFLSFYYLYSSSQKINSLLRFSFLIRLILLFALPALSNDFYRFIWDGRLSTLGFNPYLILPNEFALTDNMQLMGPDGQELLKGQGTLSPANYTCYPPVNQFLFIVPVWLFPQNILMSVVLMRLILIAADLGTIHYGRKILNALGLPESNILLYALNPFVILEITGNLHFEGVLIFFLVLALFFMLRNKYFRSAIFLTLSVSVKLIPLIFIPLFLKILGQRKLLIYLFFVLGSTLLLFLPFLSSELFTNFTASIDLYFRKFEFNASFYYLIRQLGFRLVGWNIIQKAGPMLGLIVFIFVMIIAIVPDNRKPKTLLVSSLFAVSFYYFMATTVHPWYITIPLILSVFTKYRFPVVWSFVVMMSYSAYSNAGFKENLWLLTIEYSVLYGYLVYELLKNRRQLSSISDI